MKVIISNCFWGQEQCTVRFWNESLNAVLLPWLLKPWLGLRSFGERRRQESEALKRWENGCKIRAWVNTSHCDDHLQWNVHLKFQRCHFSASKSKRLRRWYKPSVLLQPVVLLGYFCSHWTKLCSWLAGQLRKEMSFSICPSQVIYFALQASKCALCPHILKSWQCCNGHCTVLTRKAMLKNQFRSPHFWSFLIRLSQQKSDLPLLHARVFAGTCTGTHLAK